MLFSTALVLSAGLCLAQKLSSATRLTPLPNGTTLPVRLSHGLKAGKSRAGTPVLCFTTQRIPISATQYLPAGVELSGSVTASSAGDKSAGQPATLAIHFESLRWRKHTEPVTLRALAIANFSTAEDTYDPISGGGDRENSTPANWATVQVGGDVLTRFNWEGELDNARTQKVGYSDFYGVYADPIPIAAGGFAIPHAVGIFSTTAGGLYGFDHRARLQTSPGSFTVTSPGNLPLRSGDQMLLEVVAAP